MQLFHLQDLALGIGRYFVNWLVVQGMGSSKDELIQTSGQINYYATFFLLGRAEGLPGLQWQVLPAISNQVSCTTLQFLNMIESHVGDIFLLNHDFLRTLFPTNLGMTNQGGLRSLWTFQPETTGNFQVPVNNGLIMVNIAYMDPMGLIFSGTLLVLGRGYTENLINTIPHPSTIGWCEKNDLWDIIRFGWKKHNLSKSKPWKSWDLNTSLPTRPTNIWGAQKSLLTYYEYR